jgi:FAD binding domain-containing protein
MNTGMLDATNLGWKLALVVAGRAPESLLDSYGQERGPVATQVWPGVAWGLALLAASLAPGNLLALLMFGLFGRGRMAGRSGRPGAGRSLWLSGGLGLVLAVLAWLVCCAPFRIRMPGHAGWVAGLCGSGLVVLC